MMDDAELVAEASDKKKKKKPKTKKASTRGADSRAKAAPVSDSGGGGDDGGADDEGAGNGRSSGGGNKSFAKARSLAKEGKFAEASRILFQLSRGFNDGANPAQVKYILGLTLYEMKLYQTAAFVFYDVVEDEAKGSRDGKFFRLALEKLILAADALDSDVLLKHAVKRLKEDQIPANQRDMFYFRSGEVAMSEKKFQQAASDLGSVQPGSPFFAKAKYKQALAHAEAGELEKAKDVFEELATASEDRGVTDVNRVSGLLGKARVLYQKQAFGDALETYRQVPRDTEQWHEALFESTWAMLRAGMFRSALSNFHSLHSDFYEDFYQPESLILRAIVYLFICRYDEMEKVLNLFEKVYKPVLADVKHVLQGSSDPLVYFKEIDRVAENYGKLRASKKSRSGYQIPFLVARHVMKEGDVRRSLKYIERLEEEKRQIKEIPGGWAVSPVGQYALKIVDRRLESTQVFAGKLIKRHIANIGRDLVDLFEQNGLLRFETIRGQKESVKKEIAGKGLVKSKVDQETNRNFYVQNGFEYWPFRGEYWLDEIGNYHYVGVGNCE